LGEIIMPEITQAQIEKWEKDSEILDMVEKILENDLKKTWYLDHLVNIIKIERNKLITED
jgi:hypothetical protein